MNEDPVNFPGLEAHRSYVVSSLVNRDKVFKLLGFATRLGEDPRVIDFLQTMQEDQK
jgi:hypothetical protein